VRQFREIFGFELRYQLRQPMIYVSSIIFFLITFLIVTTDGIQLGGAVGNVNRNAPFVLMQLLMIMTIFGIFTTTLFVGNAAYRDYEQKTDALFFTAPIRKVPFLAGRFGGSFTMSIMVFVAAAIAFAVGNKMWWLDKDTLGPFSWKPYFVAFGIGIIPNLLLISALFFCVASLTRNIMATYASMVLFFVGYLASRRFTSDIENDHIAALVDPFGINAFSKTARYWTVFEKNTRLPWPPTGDLMMNRLLWLGVGLLLVGFTIWRFRFEQPNRAGKWRPVETAAPLAARAALVLPRVEQRFDRSTWFQQFRSVLSIELPMVLKGIPFLIVTALAVANTVFVALAQARNFGTPVYPVTHLMVNSIAGGFAFLAIVLLTFYAGEMVWRERQVKLNEVVDATPVSNSAVWSAKLLTIGVLSGVMLIAATVAMLLVQTAKGFHNYELGLYAKGVFLTAGAQVFLICILAFVVQVLTSNKYAGFLLVLVYFVLTSAMPPLHFEHNLYLFFVLPDPVYSDMNGFGHFFVPQIILFVYWIFAAALLVIATHLLWARGTETSFASRLHAARDRFNGTTAALLAVFTLAFLATGCYIFYNENVLNHYETADKGEKRQAETEKKYKRYAKLAQPRITDVQADVDIYPEKRSATIRGHYAMMNKSPAPIPELHVTLPPELKGTIEIPGATIKSRDKELGYTIYKLTPPLPPGASLQLSYNISVENPGFVNSRPNNNFVENGTFFNNASYFPHLGYPAGVELQDRSKRKKYGLGPIERLRPATDMQARMVNGLSTEADWINLDTTVSTSADQIALAPGYLQKEWTAGGRRYFHYKTTAPILDFWAYLSARYQVKRDSWKGIPIEIYYDAKHPYNVDRMIYGVKKALDYCTTNFSPYQHQQVRILEFPRYASFAQSFPNTIPYSESIGFIADLRNPDNIDYVFYVTAHEVAHQWWGHQAVSGNVQGETMVVETMAQYSALMVMEKEYGKAHMRKFLKWELDRYLNGRGGELVAEMPLEKVENQQYLHYRKGSLVMYALRDYIGEDRVNAACREFLRKYAFTQPPYPTALDLVEEFRKQTPPEQRGIITDLFETITLYDNKTTEVKATPLPGDKYHVTFTVESKKLRGDGKGAEQPIAINDWIDVGVLAAGKTKDDDKVLFMEKRHITQPKTTFDIEVSGKPTKAGIDPFNKLIDRNPDDNTKKL
jgi:ABC-type transport system involved in multi-copper enzyme maturation permease subunit